MTGEPERGNGLPVGLERGNVLGLVPNVLAGLVTNHEVSNGIQYSYASHPCSHVSLETFNVGKKRKEKEGIRKPSLYFVLLSGGEKCTHPACEGRCEM